MTYSFIIKDEAIKELSEAIVWYENQQEGLGISFREKFHIKLNQVCANPFHYKNTYKEYHEALTDTFPFQIVYAISEKEHLIVIVAVFHTSRNPKRKFRKI